MAVTTPVAVPRGTPPSRITTRTVLEWGLLTIPVELFSGVSESTGTGRSQFVVVDDEYHEVGNQLYDKVTKGPVERAAIVKGVREGDQVVEVTDEELADASAERGTSPVQLMRRADFPDLRAWAVPRKVYQLRPAREERGKVKVPNRAASRALGFLADALARHDAVGLARVVLREGGAAQYGLIEALPEHGELRLSLVHFREDLRPPLPLELPEPSGKERKLIDQLVRQSALTEWPELANEQAERLRDVVATKRAGGSVAAVTAPTVADEDSLLELLAASVGDPDGLADAPS
jgi:non-homologous end joining protein Ku